MLVIGAGCTPVRVISSEENPDADFSRYQTFSFYGEPEEAGPYLSQIKEAISLELEARGITPADNADLMVNIAVDVRDVVQTRETDLRDAPRYTGTRNYHWESEEIVVNEYEEGTVIIDIVDSELNRMVWQGMVAGTITENPDKMKSRIFTGIDKLFSKFPLSEKT